MKLVQLLNHESSESKGVKFMEMITTSRIEFRILNTTGRKGIKIIL